MIAAGIALLALVGLALLRVGAAVSYGERGLRVVVNIGLIKYTILPRKKRLKSAYKPPKTRKKRVKKAETGEKPGAAADFRLLLSGAVRLLGKLRRRLMIRELTLLYIAPGRDDPMSAALGCGGISAALGLTQAALESAFRVRRYSLRTEVNFLAGEAEISAAASISMAIWEILSLGLAALGLYLKARGTKTRGASPLERRA